MDLRAEDRARSFDFARRLALLRMTEERVSLVQQIHKLSDPRC
jgi:hypothetical protein